MDWLASGRSGPLVPRLPRDRRQVGDKGGSVKAVAGRSLRGTAPAVPYAAPARPVSCRKQPSALHAACLPGARTASGGGWASPAPPSTPSCAAPDSTATRDSITPHGRPSATKHAHPGALVHLTSRSSAASRGAAAGASRPASRTPAAILGAVPSSVRPPSCGRGQSLPLRLLRRGLAERAWRDCHCLPSSGRWPASKA